MNDNVHRGTLLTGTLSLSNTLLGTGMLAMPAAFASAGLLQGAFLVALAGLGSIIGLSCLAKCAQRLNSRECGFSAVAALTHPSAVLLFDLAIAIKCFGVAISYLIVIGDLMPKISLSLSPNLCPTSVLLRKEFWIPIAILFIAPLCYLRQLSSLKHVSILALFGVVYLSSLVVGLYYYPLQDMPTSVHDTIVWFKWDIELLKSLPIFIFAFTCHQNIFTIHNELRDNGYFRVRKVIIFSVLIAFCIYETLGTFGYLTFGRLVRSNLIAMYPVHPIVTAGQFAIVLLVCSSYPLQCHPCRLSIEKMLSRAGYSRTLALSRSLTTLLLISTLFLAVTIQNLSTILALVGATGSTSICYILPGILYANLPDAPQWTISKGHRTFAYGFALLGLFIMVLCLNLLFFGVGH